MRQNSIQAHFPQFFSNPDARGAVELQQFRCRAPDRRPANDACSLEAKRNQPIIAPWVEKLHNRAGVGINGGDVRAFPPVAVEAGQPQVLDGGGSTVLRCDDMIRFVCHD